MFGGIAARGRLLVVADAVGEARFDVFDLDERRLASRFHFASETHIDVGGIALAEDSSLWVPDTAASRLRRFSLFGNEGGGFGSPPSAVLRDRRGLVVHPRAVAIDRHARLWVCCGKRAWVHGLQVYERSGRFVMSVASRGDRLGHFGPAVGVSIRGDEVFVADFGNDIVQCFRDDGSFVGAHDLDGAGKPVSVAAFEGGHAVLVLEPSPRVLLFDRNYRCSGSLDAPRDQVFVDPSAVVCLRDEVFVLDRDAARVRSFGVDGTYRGVVFDALEW